MKSNLEVIKLKKLVVFLFFVLLIIWSIVLPNLALRLGHLNKPSTILTLLVSASGLLLLTGWGLAIKYIIDRLVFWSFDVGCGWIQYLESDHYKNKGYELNMKMLNEGLDLITRAQKLLLLFYSDNNFEMIDSSHGKSVKTILDRNNIFKK